ncbi:MAG TPA: hypothetical protein VHD62_05895 [Opitutaceae bacterium]|nr:hypothetical protein [Opitutaceae bacterium]
MAALLDLLLVALLARQLQGRVALLAGFRGLPGYLLGLGLALFLADWANFLLYAIAGWSRAYLLLSNGVLLGAILLLFATRGARRDETAANDPTPRWRWRGAFGFVAALVLLRFGYGLATDRDGNLWCNFNFIDTAFHLSVAQAFLNAPRFPPMDLDAAPFPLKYHFLADFSVAHFVRLGLAPLRAVWLLNVVGAAAMVGALWATFARWLRLAPRWVLLAVLIFLCLNTSLLNLLHFVLFQRPFFNPAAPFLGIFLFPYFNFEFALMNLFEPQRGLVFALPVVLLVLHGAFGDAAEGEELSRERRAPARPERTTLEAFALVCLLPLAHIVAFAVGALALAPKVWRERAVLLPRVGAWLPFLALGLLQLAYLLAYGPPTHPGYSGWDATQAMPLADFAALPSFLRRAAFWFFTDGDFLFWGALFAALAFARRKRGVRDAWNFLARWKWFFAVTGFFFVLINFYRYSFSWGDTNKFVLFLNLGLAWIIVLGAAEGERRGRPLVAHALWIFFFGLCALPPAYEFYSGIVAAPHDKILLFPRSEREAATWLEEHLPPGTLVLTAAYNDAHFVTALAGRPTLAGIYGDSNPYRQDERQEAIRRVYEEGQSAAWRALGIRYVCFSDRERLRYKLNPRWLELLRRGTGVVFHAGGGPEEGQSVYVVDVSRLGT